MSNPGTSFYEHPQDLEEFKSRLLGRPHREAQPDEAGVRDVQAADAASGAPLVRATMADMFGRLQSTATQRAGDFEESMLPGSVDRERSIDLNDYKEFYSLPEDRREEYLLSKYGHGNVARDVEGEYMVRQENPETQGMDWVPLYAEGQGMRYKMQRLAGPRAKAELIGSVLGSSVYFAPGVGQMGGAARFATASLASALGRHGAGYLAEEATLRRTGLGAAGHRGDMLKNRAMHVPLDVLADYIFAGGLKMVMRGVTPFPTPPGGDIQVDARNSAAIINRALQQGGHPERHRLSLGQRTGNKQVMTLEEFMSHFPGPETVLSGQQKARLAAINAYQRMQLGQLTPSDPPPIPRAGAIDDVGERVLQMIRDEAKPFLNAVHTSRQNALRSIMGEAETGVLQQTGGFPQYQSLSNVGGDFRRAAHAMRQQMKDDTGIGAFYAQPEAKAMDVPVAGLAQKFREFMGTLPTAQVARQTDAGEDVTQDVLLNQWVPSGALSKLKQVLDVEDGVTSVNSLRAMRTLINDITASPVAMPQEGTRHLRQLHGMISDEMEGAISRWGKPDQLEVWRGANRAYYDMAGKLERPGIAELFIDARSPGYWEDEAISNYVISNRDAYKVFGEFFGESSAQMRGLRQAYAGKAIEDSLADTGGGFIDPAKFASRLDLTWRNNPDLARSTFGEESRQLGQIAAAISEYRTNPRVPLEEIEHLFSSGRRPTIDAFRRMIDAQAAKDQLFSNQLIRAAAEGNLPDVPKHQVVNSLLNDPSLGFKDIQQIMNVVRKDPETHKMVRRLALADIYRRGGSAATAADNPAILRGDFPAPDLARLRESLGLSSAGASGDVASNAARVREVIGDDLMEKALHITKVLTPVEVSREAHTMAGAISGGAEQAKVIRMSPDRLFNYGFNRARGWLIARIAEGSVLESYLSNQIVTPKVRAALFQAEIASAPFIAETLAEFGETESYHILRQLKNMVDNMYRTAKLHEEITQPLVEPEIDKEGFMNNVLGR